MIKNQNKMVSRANRVTNRSTGYIEKLKPPIIMCIIEKYAKSFKYDIFSRLIEIMVTMDR